MLDETPPRSHRPQGGSAHARSLDFSPLSRPGSLRARWYAVLASTRLIMGLILSVLLLLPPAIGLPIIFLRDGPVAWGAALFLGILLACGAVIIADVHRSSARGGRLQAFARANDLELTTTLAAPEYQAGPFRGGARTVHHSVRTKRPPIIEVGDSWPMGAVEVDFHGTSNLVTPGSIPVASVFLRAVLSGPVHEEFTILHGQEGAPLSDAGFMTSAIDDALYEFSGAYTLEVTRSELTVMGTVPLDPGRTGHVERGIELIEALAARAEELLVVPEGSGSARVSPGPFRRGHHPLVKVAAVLTMFVVLSLGFAIVMSITDDIDGSPVDLGHAVMMLFILVTTVVVARLLRWLSRGRRIPRARRSTSAQRRGGERRDPRP